MMREVEDLQQDVSVRPTGRLIGDQDRLQRQIEKDRRLVRMLSKANGRDLVEASVCAAELELDLVRVELRMR